MIIALIALSASLVVIGNFARMPWLNPITALVAPWLTVMLLASIPGTLNPLLSAGLWAMVLTGFTATAVGSLTGWFVSDTRRLGTNALQQNLIAAIALRAFALGRVSALPVLVMLIVWSFFVNAILGDFRYLYLTIIASIGLPWILYGSKSVIGLGQHEMRTMRGGFLPR